MENQFGIFINGMKSASTKMSRRLGVALQLSLIFLGDQYEIGEIWDEWPTRCYVCFNVGKHDPEGTWYTLMAVSHRDLHYLSDSTLALQLAESIPMLFEDDQMEHGKNEDNGCI